MIRIRYVRKGVEWSFACAAFEMPEEQLGMQIWRTNSMPRLGRLVVLRLAPAAKPREKGR